MVGPGNKSVAPLALLSSTRCFLHARAWARDGGLRADVLLALALHVAISVVTVLVFALPRTNGPARVTQMVHRRVRVWIVGQRAARL
jgi:hypothetical protein